MPDKQRPSNNTHLATGLAMNAAHLMHLFRHSESTMNSNRSYLQVLDVVCLIHIGNHPGITQAQLYDIIFPDGASYKGRLDHPISRLLGLKYIEYILPMTRSKQFKVTQVALQFFN